MTKLSRLQRQNGEDGLLVCTMPEESMHDPTVEIIG